MSANAGPWVILPTGHSQARLNLFCFPHAGGTPAAFRSWPATLPASIAVCPVLLPGRERRRNEPLPTRFPELLDQLTQGLEPFLDRPFAFFGHSFGAILAFEVARRVQVQRGLSPIHLFVASRVAPQRRPDIPCLHQLADADFTREVTRRYNGIPAPILADPALLAYFLPVLRADFTMLETYMFQPGEPLRSPVSAVGGRADQEISRDELAAWYAVTQGDFALRMFAGDHFFHLTDPAPVLAFVAESLLRQPL